MTAYGRWLFWLVAIFLLSQFSSRVFGAADVKFPNGISPDGRFGTQCGRVGMLDDPVCFVPFARLIASPERYDGKAISITGLLIEVYGRPMIFPSKESYESGSMEDAIEFAGDMPIDWRPKLKQGMWVRVVGKFDGKFMGRSGALGAIWHTMAIDRAIDLHSPKAPMREPPKVQFIKPASPKLVPPEIPGVSN